MRIVETVAFQSIPVYNGREQGAAAGTAGRSGPQRKLRLYATQGGRSGCASWPPFRARVPNAFLGAQERNLDPTVQTLQKPTRMGEPYFPPRKSIVPFPSSRHLLQKKTNGKHYHISLSSRSLAFLIFVLDPGRDQNGL